MRFFRNLPIRIKLTLLMVLTSAAALLIATGAMVVHEIVQFRNSLVRELSTEAEIIAANSAAAIAFSDAPAAWEILTALRAHPGIIHACLFKPDGEIFAEFAPEGENFPPMKMERAGHRFEDSYVLVFHKITLGGNQVGTIGIRCHLREQNDRLKVSAQIASLTLAVSLLAALLLSIRLQRTISKPLLELADVAHEVTRRQDYSLRAVKRSEDEIGQLVEEFNQMLVQIEQRDADLNSSEERFRQMAESIQEVFWLSSLPDGKTIYVSPAYEAVWGRSRETLYASASHWFDFVHPDDRPRVVNVLKHLPPDREVNEVYRIIRADGSIRWIHDRGFPVRNKSGVVYRRAGIAEDITQRKEVEEALRRLEANYRSIFENAIDGIFQTTAEGHYLAANPAMARILGYESPNDFVASLKNLDEEICVNPERAIELRRLLIRDGEVRGFEIELYRKDRSKIWVRLNVRVARDSAGKILYYEGSAQDITTRRHLEKQLIEISDREQSRMGQDLHDGLCQHLVRTAFTANLLEKDLAAGFSPQTHQAQKLCQLMDDAITQARNLARGLYPVKLEVEGLVSALQELAANIRSAYDVICEVDISGSINFNDPALATHLYRIAQEGTINAVKHARPKQVKIRIISMGRKVYLTVSDDGVGIPLASMSSSGMGLHIMHYRASLIGAELQFQRNPLGGTIVSCIFEVKNGIEKATRAK